MSEKRLQFQTLKRRLLSKRRFIVYNEDTLAESFSLKLTLMNVFVVTASSAILIVFLTTIIIAFTPLREYIPGYASTELKKQATKLTMQSDSLLRVAQQNNQYINAVKAVLNGNLEFAKLNKDSIQAAIIKSKEIPIARSEKEQELRKEVENDDKYNVFEKVSPKVNQVFFAPVKGTITKPFKKYYIEIAAPRNTPVLAVASGTIVFSEWTIGKGYVVIIKHKDDFLSIYKNIASVTKSQGAFVKTGEVIAETGFVSATQNKVSLQFELWKNSAPVDPTQYINFQ
jgi:murein DD-endopeptidase MepM/ murein hydrolase activator NlpD